MRNLLIATIVALLVGSLVMYRQNTSSGTPLLPMFEAVARRVGGERPKPLTDEERRVQQELEEALGEQTAVDRVVRTDGHEVRGQIVEENDRHVKITQSFGESGDMTLTISRARIHSVHRADAEVPAISLRDVRFKMQFPHLNLYRRPPFTIMTSQNYFDVEDVTRLLHDQHADFVDVFAPVIANPERNDGIQLLFFSEEQAFRAYQREHAPGMGFSIGFYSAGIDRFAIYDQKSSTQVKNAEKRLTVMKDKYGGRTKSRRVASAVKTWHQREANRLHQNANQANMRTLRHEGAHQLFHTYGVHSDHNSENLWLVEGLAVYCENERIGNRPVTRFEQLREAAKRQRHIPFPKLIDFRDPSGFGGIGSGDDVSLAYAQSWLVVDFAMQPQHREKLFDYIRYVRDPLNIGPLNKHSRFETLSQFLEMSPAELDKTLIDQMRRL